MHLSFGVTQTMSTNEAIARVQKYEEQLAEKKEKLAYERKELQNIDVRVCYLAAVCHDLTRRIAQNCESRQEDFCGGPENYHRPI